MVEEWVEGDGDEVHEHDLDDGPQPRHRCAHAGAEEGALADRGVAHALRPVAQEDALAQGLDVLAEDDDPLVAGHRLLHGSVDCLGEVELSHGGRSP